MTNVIGVYFPTLNVSDIITQVGGLTPQPSTTGTTLTNLNPEFYIEKDFNGVDRLCVVKSDQSSLTIITNNGGGPVTHLAAPAGEYFVGPRPNDRFNPKGK